MKRSDFFTRLVLGFVAIWKAPELLAKTAEPKTKGIKDIITSNPMLKKIEYSNKWFEDNYSWLKYWIKNYRVQSWKKNGEQLSMDEYYDGMQIFQDFPFIPSTPVEIMEEKDGSQTLMHGCKYVNSKLEEHIKEIIRFAVFSKKFVISRNGQRIGSMAGFVEQMGRLPIKSDKVRFVISSKDAKGMRFLNARKSKNEYGDTLITFLSDCRLEIAGKVIGYNHYDGTSGKFIGSVNVNN